MPPLHSLVGRFTDADQHRRYLPGPAQVKNKIKRVDRLLGNESLHRDISLIFKNIIDMTDKSAIPVCHRC